MRQATILTMVKLLFLFCSCDPRYGFIESNFQLSPDSRLPRWLTIPSGYSRKDLTVTLRFYTHTFLNKVKIDVHGPLPEHKKLMEKIGTVRWHPFSEQQFKEQRGYGVYPNYSIIVVDHIEEIFEQRCKGDILTITDDPKLTQALKQSKTP